MNRNTRKYSRSHRRLLFTFLVFERKIASKITFGQEPKGLPYCYPNERQLKNMQVTSRIKLK